MTKLKTLGELLAEDVSKKMSPDVVRSLVAVSEWLQRHGIEDDVPLKVECGEAVIGKPDTGHTITGRTLIPLPSGPVLVEKEVWEAGARKLAMEMGFWDGNRATPTAQEVKPALTNILSAIFPAGVLVEEPYDSIHRAEVAESTGIPLTGGGTMHVRKGDDITVTTRRRKDQRHD